MYPQTTSVQQCTLWVKKWCYSSLKHNFCKCWPILAEHCNCIASSAIPIRCRLSVVTRVYCDKMAEVKTMQSSVKCSTVPQLCAWWAKFDGSPLDLGGSNWGGVVFERLRNGTSPKRCEIELKWQLITNRKLYVGFRLQQKSKTLNDLEVLNVNLLLCRRRYAYCDQTTEARVTLFTL